MPLIVPDVARALQRTEPIASRSWPHEEEPIRVAAGVRAGAPRGVGGPPLGRHGRQGEEEDLRLPRRRRGDRRHLGEARRVARRGARRRRRGADRLRAGQGGLGVSVPLKGRSPSIGVLKDWVEESYRRVAPKTLVRELDERVATVHGRDPGRGRRRGSPPRAVPAGRVQHDHPRAPRRARRHARRRRRRSARFGSCCSAQKVRRSAAATAWTGPPRPRPPKRAGYGRGTRWPTSA